MALLVHAGIEAQSLTLDPCRVPGVTVATAPLPEYYEVADEVLGAERQAGVDAWLPYGVALTNRTSQHILAVAVRWVVTTSKGQTVTVIVTPGVFEQPRQQIAPGKSVMVLPVAFLGGTAGNVPRKSDELILYRSASRIRVSLDGVLFGSGQFVGPNSHKEFEQLAAAATAPAHVASTVLAMQASGEAIGTVVAWLEQKAKAAAPGGDANAQFAARTAKSLLQEYKRGGEALLYESAAGLAQGPVLHLYR